MTPPGPTFDEQLQHAARLALAAPLLQDMVLGWLRTACAHLGESGLKTSDPQIATVTGSGKSARPVPDGTCTAYCRLELPGCDYFLGLELTLQAGVSSDSFGSTRALLEAFGPEFDAAGAVCGSVSLVQHELFSTPSFETKVSPRQSVQALQELVVMRIHDAQKQEFRYGVGPSLHRFRLALEEALAP